MTTETRKKETDTNITEGNDSDGSQKRDPDTRQDLFVCFTNEKDLRHYESIKIKSSLYTGIAVRVRNLVPSAMDNLLYAIELDAQDQKKEEEVKHIDHGVKNGIVNLRFEETRLSRKAANSLSEFLKKKPILETLGLVKVTFEDVFDFKKILEGVQLNTKLSKILFSNSIFDEELYGKSIARALIDSRSIKELDLSYVSYDHPKCFYDISTAILNERCRLNILKIRGTQLTNLEGKIIQYILMKNKQLHTLDLSFCRTDDPENFMCFLQKLDQFCNIRYLTLDCMQPDLNTPIETMGEALATNNKLEVLIMRENKIKWVQYCNFWNLILTNTTLLKMNLQKTDLSDRVVEKMGKYLEQPNVSLVDLDISKNQITDAGLKTLCVSLKINQTIKFLNLSGNKIKDDGLNDLVDVLNDNKTLQELALGSNIISNDGIIILSRFLHINTTLTHLEIPKNSFTDTGFDVFAKAFAFNKGLKFLDIAKNKDLTDESSLITLAEALIKNRALQTLDLSSLKIRKPYLKQHFEPALRKNITLQKVIGKIPPSIISHELDVNITIEREILNLYQPICKIGKGMFNLKLVEKEENMSRLDLKDKPNKLIRPAFKFMKYFDIRSVDFSNMGINDEQINILAGYLRRNPNLRSIVLDNNPFTDDGLKRLVNELKTNTKLAHLSIKGCQNITDEGLKQLCDVISTVNTVLFQIDLDPLNFDKALALKCVGESSLNRDIQEKLKPKKILSELNFPNKNGMGKNGAEAKALEMQRQKIIAQYNALHKSRNSSIAVGSIDESDEDGTPDGDRELHESKKQPMQLTGMLEEVLFDPNANVGECFASALKAWRIHNPNVIQLPDQTLHDDQILKLCEFLKDRNMICRLNLRRNKIGNEGAKALANFIKNHDTTITHLDLTRNCIGTDGGQALLDALSTTTRIVEFEIKYGNPISSKMGRIFEREIKANLQTNQPARSKRRGIAKYELVDKGPDYMRCAIKMTELQNILHLSLPDNMLCLEDARMLCEMISKNTQLKVLNLSQNQLDADCAALLANALVYNSNLRVLNVSDNRLGDLGVNLLVAPLIRKQLQLKDICQKEIPVFNSINIKMIKNPAVSDSRKAVTITVLAQLELLDLQNNIITEESFKSLATLHKLDQEIIIQTDDPKKIRSAERLLIEQQVVEENKQRMDALQAKINEGMKPKNKVRPTDQSQVDLLNPDATQDPNKADEEKGMSSSESEEDEETKIMRKVTLEKRKMELIKQEERARNCKIKTNVYMQKFCCFKDEIKEFDMKKGILPSTKQICCWRMLRARRVANQFYTNEETIRLFEKSKSLAVVGWIITINYFAIYTIALLPFIMKSSKAKVPSVAAQILGPIDPPAIVRLLQGTLSTPAAQVDDPLAKFNNIMKIVNIAFVGTSFLSELILLASQAVKVNMKICNIYILCQFITGVTQRATILLSAQLTAVFLQEKSGISYVMGLTVGCCLIVSQLRAGQIFIVGMKYKSENLLPNTGRAYRLSYAAGYFANALIYKRIMMDPSNLSITRSKELAAEKQALMSFTGIETEKDAKKHKMNAARGTFCQWGNPKFWQLIMSDIPLLVCCPVAAIKKLVDLNLLTIIIVVTMLDILIMMTYLAHIEQLSINSDEVYTAIDERAKQNQERMAQLATMNVQAEAEDLDLLMTEESGKNFEQLNMSNISFNKTFDEAAQGLLDTDRSKNPGQKQDGKRVTDGKKSLSGLKVGHEDGKHTENGQQRELENFENVTIGIVNVEEHGIKGDISLAELKQKEQAKDIVKFMKKEVRLSAHKQTEDN